MSEEKTARTPCYLVVRFDFDGVYAHLVDEATWRWMHDGGPVPEIQAQHINELVMADLEESLEEQDPEDAVYERAHVVGGVFGSKVTYQGDDVTRPMSISQAIRYARENNLEILDSFTTEMAV